MIKLVLATALLALSVSASPAPPRAEAHLEKRFKLLSGQWDYEDIGKGNQYRLYNNLHGLGQPGTTGSQSTQVLSYKEPGTISWKTQYTWSGNPVNVKSYANVALQQGTRKKLSAIKTIPTSWTWGYNAAPSTLVADVSYDLWLSNDPKSGTASPSSTFEIMIWLSNRKAGPAGSQIATANIGGLGWKLFKGKVGTWEVYSFVALSELHNYHADLKHFFTYLSQSQGVSLDQYLVALQAGTEPFVGSGTLTTTAYSAAIN
ncbi:unnamed protein product [Rhizoctonia solani]|uniref:Xyloglucan-specific endo-beta-1,4-glucanase A n=1 Tax=Rhizoctonia solani TaxID=456999 RepID=A0A8H2XX83_9AGAM|nr:unnamed protein product [Rhizoctonia solani]